MLCLSGLCSSFTFDNVSFTLLPLCFIIARVRIFYSIFESITRMCLKKRNRFMLEWELLRDVLLPIFRDLHSNPRKRVPARTPNLQALLSLPDLPAPETHQHSLTPISTRSVKFILISIVTSFHCP